VAKAVCASEGGTLSRTLTDRLVNSGKISAFTSFIKEISLFLCLDSLNYIDLRLISHAFCNLTLYGNK